MQQEVLRYLGHNFDVYVSGNVQFGSFEHLDLIALTRVWTRTLGKGWGDPNE